jgi:DNA-binding transcriptional LysR family regulator
VLGRNNDLGERFASTILLEYPFVMVVRRGHPAIRRKLSPAAFATLPHLEISSSGEDTGFIDRWLTEHKCERRIALRTPYLSAATVLVQSDFVATGADASRRNSSVTTHWRFVSRHMSQRGYGPPCSGIDGRPGIRHIAGSRDHGVAGKKFAIAQFIKRMS